MKGRIIVVLGAMLLTACSTDVTRSSEYRVLEQQYSDALSLA